MFTIQQHTSLNLARSSAQRLINAGVDMEEAIILGKAIARKQCEYIPLNPVQDELAAKWANELVEAGLWQQAIF